jgi:hypothetical protein
VRRIILLALFPLRYYAYLTAPVSRRGAPAAMITFEPELRRLAGRLTRQL